MGIHARILTLVVACFCGVVPLPSHGDTTLSEVALFNRCFAHLTQSRIKRTDPLFTQVRAGTKTALQACTEVLDRARFTADGGTKIGDVNDTVAKTVLATLHRVHREWAREQSIFNSDDTSTLLGSEPWYDDSPYGAYVTRALFAPGFDVLSVTQGTEYLQPIRTEMNPVHSYRGVPNAVAGSEKDWRLGANHPFAPRGELLGIRPVTVAPVQVFPTPTRFTGFSGMPDFDNLGVSPTATQPLTSLNLTSVPAVQGPLAVSTNFAIRIRGQLLVQTAATYVLFLDVDDAGVLYIDGERVVTRDSVGESSASITLSAGTHNIELRFFQKGSGARLIMRWSSPTITKSPVSASAFSNLLAEYYIESRPPPIEITGHRGGGFLGNQNYLLTAFKEADQNFAPNGALKMNRSWPRAVLADALCRSIPVVRESDVTQFVIPESPVPFRQAATCSACHATTDRLSATINNLRWNVLTSSQQDTPLPDLYGFLSVTMRTPSFQSTTAWNDVADPDFGLRQPYGHLYFRNYRGELVDRVVHSIAEVGAAIRDQDDYYICFAKRYYNYFLGIDVNLGDPGDASYVQPNAAESYHRAKVIEFGLRLKESRSLRQLILDIVGSPAYRMEDFGISFSG